MKNVHDKVQYNKHLGYYLYIESDIGILTMKQTVSDALWRNVFFPLRTTVYSQNPMMFGAIEVFVP